MEANECREEHRPFSFHSRESGVEIDELEAYKEVQGGPAMTRWELKDMVKIFTLERQF